MLSVAGEHVGVDRAVDAVYPKCVAELPEQPRGIAAAGPRPGVVQSQEPRRECIAFEAFSKGCVRGVQHHGATKVTRTLNDPQADGAL